MREYISAFIEDMLQIAKKNKKDLIEHLPAKALIDNAKLITTADMQNLLFEKVAAAVESGLYGEAGNLLNLFKRWDQQASKPLPENNKERSDLSKARKYYRQCVAVDFVIRELVKNCPQDPTLLQGHAASIKQKLSAKGIGEGGAVTLPAYLNLAIEKLAKVDSAAAEEALRKAEAAGREAPQ